MKTRVLLAALLICLISFSAGTILSFISAYFVIQPHAKFTGAAAFHLGVFASAWTSLCLTLSFIATMPVYLRTFGQRSFRHLLVYGGIFVVVTGLALRSPPMHALMFVSGKIVRTITHSEIATVFFLPLQATLIATLVFCGAAWLAGSVFRRRTSLA